MLTVFVLLVKTRGFDRVDLPQLAIFDHLFRNTIRLVVC
jgi:hypothetical protein